MHFYGLSGPFLRGAFVALRYQKILVSVKFVSAILGPEMAAPILWTPGKTRSFCRKTPMSINSAFWGGVFLWGGGKCRFYFYGREDFSDLCSGRPHSSTQKNRRSKCSFVTRTGLHENYALTQNLFPGNLSTLRTLTSLFKVRPFSWASIAFRVFPLILPLSDYGIWSS